MAYAGRHSTLPKDKIMATTAEQQAYYQLKGIISDTPPEVQEKVNEAAARIRAIAAESEEAQEAQVALSLVIAELMVKA